jgi:uncharacterized protein YecT (DUF1311 family)
VRILIIAAGISIGIAACGDAQKQDAPPAQSMPMLSAANTIEACLGRYSDPAEREAVCVGQYSAACMSLRPDGGTNSGMIRCTLGEYDAWAARLNTVYITYMQGLDASRGPGLRESQQAWTALRDVDCAFEASAYEGGSIRPLIQSGCMRDYTADRTIRLLGWLDAPR